MGDTGGQGGCENDEAVRTEGVGTFFFLPVGMALILAEMEMDVLAL